MRSLLSLRNVEDPAFECGVDICYETARHWVVRFGPMFASTIRAHKAQTMCQLTQWSRYLDEVFISVNGERHDPQRAVDYEGEVLESFVTKKRDKAAALKFLKALKRHGPVRGRA